MDGAPWQCRARLMELRALFFDQDGVIVDTERDGHRVAFNRTFAEFGLPVEWDTAAYRGLLRVGGGKERMRHYLHSAGFGKPVPAGEEDALIAALHHRKTAIFVEMIESGALPLRPGVHRFMREAVERGILVGICTTSDQRAAQAIIRTHLADIPIGLLLAGDVAQRKKPDPDIYLQALQRTGRLPAECLVVEDSQNGVEAAAGAGLRVVATVNDYTASEDLSRAIVVTSSLGDPGAPCRVLRGPAGLAADGMLHVEECSRLTA